MICKDCELEVTKLNKKGICPSCAHRQANANWAGEQYVPIKDLKGTKGYNIAIARRLKLSDAKLPEKRIKSKDLVLESNTEEVEKPIEEVKESLAKIVPKTTKDNFKDQCYEVVLKDAKAKFKEFHLDLNFYKDIDMKGFLSTFTELLNNRNIYDDCKKAEDIFNGLSIDYDHYLEKIEWNEAALKNVLGLKKALLELRRPNQNFIYNYSAIKPLLDYLRKDKVFMQILDDTQKKVENNEPEVYGARASELVSSQDFATKRYTYQCEVPGYGLYGERGRSLFTTQMSAISEENAKDKLNEFLARKFSTFAYNQKDIRITKI